MRGEHPSGCIIVTLTRIRRAYLSVAGSRLDPVAGSASEDYLPRMAAHLRLAHGHGTPEPGPQIRVVLGEAHEAMRRTLKGLLQAEPMIELVAEAGCLADTMRAVLTHRPHVLTLDLRMPDGLSIHSIGQLREQAPETAIVVLTMHQSQLVAKRVLEAGASGFVLKDSADTELTEAVSRAARGRRYASPRVMLERACR